MAGAQMKLVLLALSLTTILLAMRPQVACHAVPIVLTLICALGNGLILTDLHYLPSAVHAAP